MCTIICKKFPHLGWIGFKNRDRSEATVTDLKRTHVDHKETVTLVDEHTQWGEGMSSNGVSVISSSLTPSSGSDDYSVNGHKIRESLKKENIEDTVEYLKKSKITGCVMVFNTTECWLIEGQVDSEKFKIKPINENYVARTNHGVWLPQAGYQPTADDPEMHMHFLSSVARLHIAEYVAKTAKSPAKIMTDLAKKWAKIDSQFNTLRIPDGVFDTRTTEQLMIVPSKLMMFVRNTDGRFTFNQRTANLQTSKILVGVVD